ncbi:YdcF family protein [Phormidium pseudopriestleyi FRX01]|uniref:YdcF family protein n=1 Tax=Phormidium pseudopriestleyi FRX01 TaxID=1759528 RepID=A0ABS3FS62_9CYAN|nr:ElyC/SanA/YdcF family protein [Phormidium pseudopriestleyi]MBO0349824.1 YdcF family protein [Phormidium pseudopriestleyi FRX01]
MILAITQLLLWVVVALLIWYVLLQLIPREYLTWLGGAILLSIIVLAFFFPTEQGVATLWYILSFPLRPLGLCIVLLCAATRRLLINRLYLVGAALVILVLCSVPWLAQHYQYWLIRSNFPIASVCPAQGNPNLVPVVSRPEGIVLLSSGISQPSLPYQPELIETNMSDLIVTTVRQYQLQQQVGHSPRVIVAARPQPFPWQGVSAPWYSVNSTDILESDIIRNLLIVQGVSPTHIFVLNKVENVRQSAEAVAELLPRLANRNPRVIVVTSVLHLPRASLAFQRLDLDVIPRSPSLYPEICALEQLRTGIYDIIPNATSLALTSRVVEEFYTLMYYFLRSWVEPCTRCNAN